MAENEILDLSSRRWRNTRAALATPNMLLTSVAECVADDLNRGLNLQLSKAFRAGATLLTVLHASEQHPAAMRAAVENFQDQQLARIARDAIKATPTRDPAHVAQCATQMLLDGMPVSIARCARSFAVSIASPRAISSPSQTDPSGSLIVRVP